MNKSDSIAALAVALSKAQAEMTTAKKDAENPYFKSRYADLASVWEACRAPLAKYGLSVCQMPESLDGHIVVHTLLMHASGEWISSDLRLKPVKDDPQGMGSAITYARRYALSAAVGIAPEDDDANLASGKDVKSKVTTEAKTFGVPKEVPIQPLPPLEDLLKQSVVDAGGYIERGMQVNFNKAFREALPNEFKPQAENIRHAWLASQFILDADGNPSATAILKKEFQTIRDKAEKFAREYKG